MRPSYVRSNESCCIIVRLVPIHLGFWFLIKPAQISSTKLLDHGLVWPNLAQSMQSLYYSENVIILDLEAQKRPSPQVPAALCAALFLSKIAVGCGICSQFDVSGFPKIDPLPPSLNEPSSLHHTHFDKGQSRGPVCTSALCSYMPIISAAVATLSSTNKGRGKMMRK